MVTSRSSSKQLLLDRSEKLCASDRNSAQFILYRFPLNFTFPRSKTGFNYATSAQRLSQQETGVMDVQLEADTGDMGLDGLNERGSRGDHDTQPDHSRAPVDQSETTSEEAPSLDRTNQTSCDSSLTGEVTTNEDTSPTSHGVSDLTQRTEFTTYEKRLKHGSIHSGHLTNGAPPICTPPSQSTGRLSWPPPQSTKNNGQVHLDKKTSPSTCTANSQHSLKATTSQIQQVAGDDCCVHCVLACLFCELWSLCSVMVQCLACGRGCEALCCCGSEATGDVACGDDACCDALDCGILEDCCESSDCLEICLECCSICFPA
ncbi:uncharacterized protein [Paramormyrops kingsleyae]|uniref:uncharacterized protein isoform X1 n=1 Tax=Paramormyrops kingsleyae TaxID=1676925 RepID=UPI000CD65BBD|nr:myoD family inhibitor domain-containing protein-like [Paramormyrops kingsleyae]